MNFIISEGIFTAFLCISPTLNLRQYLMHPHWRIKRLNKNACIFEEHCSKNCKEHCNERSSWISHQYGTRYEFCILHLCFKFPLQKELSVVNWLDIDHHQNGQYTGDSVKVNGAESCFINIWYFKATALTWILRHSPF